MFQMLKLDVLNEIHSLSLKHGDVLLISTTYSYSKLSFRFLFAFVWRLHGGLKRFLGTFRQVELKLPIVPIEVLSIVDVIQVIEVKSDTSRKQLVEGIKFLRELIPLTD